MQVAQGSFQSGQRLTSRFLDVAGEYVLARNQRAWIYVPHMVTVSDPSDEAPLRAAFNEMELSAALKEPAQRAEWREEWRYHYKNLLIELRERIPEVFTALHARPDIVISDTIQPLGLKDYRYHFGAQLRPDMIAALKEDPELRHCNFRRVHMGDIAKALRLRIAA